MVDFSCKVDGLAEMEAALRVLGAEMGANTLRAALRDAAKPFVAELEKNVPVSNLPPRLVKTHKGRQVQHLSGFMRSRIKVRTQLAYATRGKRRGTLRKGFGQDKQAVAKVSAGIYRVPYVGYIEYGRNGVPPNRFFLRSVNRSTQQVINTFQTRLGHRIKLAQRRAARLAAKAAAGAR